MKISCSGIRLAVIIKLLPFQGDGFVFIIRGCVISLNNGSRRRAESPKAPSPGQRPGYVVCEPVALKGQKLYNITQPT